MPERRRSELTSLLNFLVATVAFYVGWAIRVLIAFPARKSAERLARDDHPTWGDYFGDYYWLRLVRHHGVLGYAVLYLTLVVAAMVVTLVFSALFQGDSEIFLILPLWPVIPLILLYFGYIKTIRLSVSGAQSRSAS